MHDTNASGYDAELTLAQFGDAFLRDQKDQKGFEVILQEENSNENARAN